MPRPSWDDYFLEIAAVVAKRSTCLRVPEGIGAVLVRDRQILATGYGGSIRGAAHCDEVGCLVDEKTGGCVRTVHAEVNAILQAAEHGVGVRGATVYSTMSPCWDCFKALANAGVERIVYGVEYRTIEQQRVAARVAGVALEHVGDRKYAGGVEPRAFVVAAVIVRDGCVLLARRRDGGEFAGLWECPGGKIEATDATAAGALEREIREELGVSALVGAAVGQVDLDPPEAARPYRVAFFIAYVDGEPRPLASSEIVWASVETLQVLRQEGKFTPANRALYQEIVREVTTSALRTGAP